MAHEGHVPTLAYGSPCRCLVCERRPKHADPSDKAKSRVLGHGPHRTVPLLSEGRALARLFLLDQVLEELVGKGLMRHPGVNFGGLPAVGCRDGQQFSVNLVGSGVRSSVNLDLDRMT